ncbi:MAG TPA: type IV pilin protein [Gammaproteobacteria bacterium]|nr:type IV pilin protein [Gammaproteobacteria bacterium]
MKYRGFTLIEILIVLVILSVLTVLAVSLYSSTVRVGRRADGVDTLLAISLAEERYRSVNTSYGTLAQVWSGVTTTTQGYYTLAISNVSATGYTVTATAIGDQANDNESGTSCATLVLTVSSGTTTNTPVACWPQ